jgi:hypothetical protein
MKCRVPFLVITVAAALLVCATPALAADGVPLYPPGVDDAYSDVSMRLADMNGPMIGVEMQPIPVVVGPFLARVYGWNAAVGYNFPLTPIGGTPVTADQRGVTVLDVGGTVFYAWMQQDDPATTGFDLWLWKGDETGAAAPGYPRRLVTGPDPSNQITPDLGLVKEADGSHIVLAWLDDRASAPTAPQVYMLDLSKDTDADGTPDYEEAAFDRTAAGTRADPSGDIAKGQWQPQVGAKGIFWIDDRHAVVEDTTKYGREVWRASLAPASSAVLFWKGKPTTSVDYLRATASGAVWLLLGPAYAGSGWEPCTKAVGGAAKTVALLARPNRLDVTGNAYAMTGGHGGATDGDSDIFFKGPVSDQVVPVCSVGDFYGGSKPIVEQIEPAISTAPGGYRLIWSDSRQVANTPATPFDQLAYQLYVALVPTVSLSANHLTVPHGHAVTFTCSVAPNFSGVKVRLQRGKRKLVTLADGSTIVSYGNWSVLKTKALAATSRATFTWTPQAKGTFYLRVWFAGGKRYTDVGTRKVPHVPNVSRVVRVVVK